MKLGWFSVPVTGLLLGGVVPPGNAAGTPVLYHGLCDASAAVALDSRHVAVADDEDNVIRVYRRDVGGQPVWSVELSPFLRVNRKSPEADIEGAARVGEVVYWITSHGRNVKGELAPSRQRFFATTGSVIGGVVQLSPVGQPYSNLLNDLVTDPRLAPFNLWTAALLAPKAPGALNIEGLATTPEGHLLIGFRNPVPQDRALLVPLLNPAELLNGGPARLGAPILLDLGGLSIRGLEPWQGGYLIVAGPWGNEGPSRLYVWDGHAARPQPFLNADLEGLNPESIALFHDEREPHVFAVSDDGTLRVGKKECKRLKNPAQKFFRGVTFTP